MRNSIQTVLQIAPDKPGVYLFKDGQEKVIYVGKASILSHRLKSYFVPANKLPLKIQKLVALIDDIEFIVTDSESAAIILECNLIKKHQPQFNVRLKDDKTFPYLKIDLSSDFPAISVTRTIKKGDAKYYGPYINTGSLRRTLKLIKRIFPYRSCRKKITGSANKPCLNYHIHRCSGPCIGAINKKEYNDIIKEVTLFLEGQQEFVVKELAGKMLHASEHMQFEKAALIRDQIKAIQDVMQNQKIAINIRGDLDAIALAQTKELALAQVFFIRNSKLIGRDTILLDGIGDEEPQQIMSNFIKQYYTSAISAPSHIVFQCPADESVVIKEWLELTKGQQVKLSVPTRGIKKQLLNIVAENAQKELELFQIKQLSTVEHNNVLAELKEKLQISSLPYRIEGYDISTIRGTNAVGSMVVFERGLPKSSQYRRFRIKTVTQMDDYAMMQEVLKRRFQKHREKDEKWMVTPDLILIDGGKGHLNTAIEVMRGLNMNSIPVISIAKENEDIFVHGNMNPIYFGRSSAALHLLQRVRDEAHRFALKYHHHLRSKRSIASPLDTIPGIGPKRKKALLIKFGAIKNIKEASIDELISVEGITGRLAAIIRELL